MVQQNFGRILEAKQATRVYSVSKPENCYMYIPYKSAHPRHAIKNNVSDELKCKWIKKQSIS